MSNRLDQERETRLQPKRMEFAKNAITHLGLPITFIDETRIEFTFQESKVTIYPYSGWFTGKSVKDGRGIEHLLKQLTTPKR